MSEKEKKEILGQEKDLSAVAGGDKCSCGIGSGNDV